jgi:hypothetical protein
VSGADEDEGPKVHEHRVTGSQALNSPSPKEIPDDAAMERTHLHTPEGGQDVAVEGPRVGDVRSGFDVGLDVGEPARGVRGEGDLAIDHLRSRLTTLADLLGEEILGNLSRPSGHAAAYASAVPVVHTPNIALARLRRRIDAISVASQTSAFRGVERLLDVIERNATASERPAVTIENLTRALEREGRRL